MKEIVVIFIQAREESLPAGQSPGAAEAEDASEPSVNSHSVPPFWTWFIENPRPRFSSSFTSLTGLTLANQSA
jgi:hypothetical protein